MFSMKKMLSVSLLLSSISLSAFAQNDISLGHPAYGGNGCPNGTASVTLSPDAKSLSIIFDQFLTEAGPSSGRTLDRKSCNIAVPVHVPNGFSISVLAVDYRGFVCGLGVAGRAANDGLLAAAVPPARPQRLRAFQCSHRGAAASGG